VASRVPVPSLGPERGGKTGVVGCGFPTHEGGWPPHVPPGPFTFPCWVSGLGGPDLIAERSFSLEDAHTIPPLVNSKNWRRRTLNENRRREPVTEQQALSDIQNVDLREGWPNEARDFTPWLAENLAKLGEVLGLERQSREAPVGPYSLDVLAHDLGSDRPVIIENQ